MMRLLASLFFFLLPGWFCPRQQFPKKNRRSRRLLQRLRTRRRCWCAFLGKTKAFSMTMTSNYDVVQDDGQKVEFGEVRQVLIDRPDRLRVQLEQSDGDKFAIYFDGKDLIFFSQKENVFTKVEKPGSVDDMLRYVIYDLQTRIPLALLLASSIKEELEKRATEVDYVERTTIDGKPVDHLAGRTADIDFQMWLAQGEQPLPLRFVITYKKDVGQPQYRANLSDWNLAPKIDDSAFAFSPPAGAEAILLMVRVPAEAAAKKGRR